jgi:hypothetical protein
MAQSPYDKMSLDELSIYIGNKNKATDIYNKTGSWDSPEIASLSQQNQAIRNKYGLSDDLDIATLNNIFSERINSYSNQPAKSSQTSTTNVGYSTNSNTPYSAEPVSNKGRQGMYQQREDYASDKMDEFLYGSGSKAALDSPIMQNIMDYYNKQGDKAYEDTLGNLAAFTGGRLNSWAARGAAGAKQDYTQAGAQMAPGIIGMVGNLYSGNRDFYAGRESEMYGRQQAEKQYADALAQQNFANQLALSELMDGATGGLRQYANPYFNPDGTLKNPNLDYQAMIDALDPNDPYYSQKRYQLEQARFAKVQLPEYQQYAQGVTAPVQAAPIWSANPENPNLQALVIANQLTKEYGPQEYQAKIAAQNLANEWYPKVTQASIDDIYGNLDIARQNATTNALRASRAGSSGSGSSSSTVKPAITPTTAINEIQAYMNRTTEDQFGNKVPAHSLDEVIEYALSFEGLGYSPDQIENMLLAAGVPQSAIDTYVDKQMYPSRYDPNTYGPILVPRKDTDIYSDDNIKESDFKWYNPFTWFK